MTDHAYSLRVPRADTVIHLVTGEAINAPRGSEVRLQEGWVMVTETVISPHELADHNGRVSVTRAFPAHQVREITTTRETTN